MVVTIAQKAIITQQKTIVKNLAGYQGFKSSSAKLGRLQVTGP